jgi:hypothetical protein
LIKAVKRARETVKRNWRVSSDIRCRLIISDEERKKRELWVQVTSVSRIRIDL